MIMDKRVLIEAAAEAALKAYAPYSGLRVGAAVLGNDDRIYTGANIENASFGLTVCAERNAVAAAVLAGIRSIRAAAVFSPDYQGILYPCGACRQVISEFGSPDTVIIVSDRDFNLTERTLGEIFPGDELKL